MSNDKASVITSKLQNRLGVESPPMFFDVDATGCRQFARAINYSNPIYYDEAIAKEKGHRGIVAPFGFLGLQFVLPGTEQAPYWDLFPDGDKPYDRILNGGTDIEYFGEICAGDKLVATFKFTELKEQEGRVGSMLIAYSETEYRNEKGDLVAKVRGTEIYY